MDKTSSSNKSTFCGFGTFSYTNCDGETLTVDRENLTPNTYAFFDDDYLACGLARIDGDCNLSEPIRGYCLDYNLPAPTPGAGYSYGSATYNRIVGGANAGFTDELALERINWVLCNGDVSTTAAKKSTEPFGT